MPGRLECPDLVNFGNQSVEFGSGQVAPVDDGGRLREVSFSLTEQARHGNKVHWLIFIGIGSKAGDLGLDNSAASVQLSVNDKNMSGERRFAAGMEIDKVARAFPKIFTGQMSRCRPLRGARGMPSESSQDNATKQCGSKRPMTSRDPQSPHLGDFRLSLQSSRDP